jgi:hypothetical protein
MTTFLKKLNTIVFAFLFVALLNSCEKAKCLNYPVKDSYVGEYVVQQNEYDPGNDDSQVAVHFIGVDENGNEVDIEIPKEFCFIDNTYIKIDCAEVYLTTEDVE